MRIIDTSQTAPSSLTQWEKDQIYNGLDTCITAEILDVLLPQLDNHTAATYSFSKALQGPILEMRLRGILIDKARKASVIDEYIDKIDILETNLERIVREGVGFFGFNWRSNAHLKELFYDRLGIPTIKKQGRPTVNRDALEKMEVYLIAKPIVRHLEAMRDLGKKISMLKTAIDPDGRMRTSYNIGGTTTGRLSSSLSEFGTGGNLQNVTEGLRSVFIADPGMKFGYFDGEQIQSRIVGAVEWNLFHDGKYLDACESGDLHTAVAKLVWPKLLPWTGVLAQDKEIAEAPYYRHYSYRFMCKKIGHGTNFDGKPMEIARQTKIERSLIEDFQPKYFVAFPAHGRWKEWTHRQLVENGYIIALSGRKRWFFGRRGDADTTREALAYEAQATESHIVNTGMLEVWRRRNCELLLQTHDGILFQYPEEREDEIIPLIREQLRFPIALAHGRELVIPYGCKTGWNWGEFSKANPEGLKSYEGGDKRRRSPPVHLLDRRG